MSRDVVSEIMEAAEKNGWTSGDLIRFAHCVMDKKYASIASLNDRVSLSTAKRWFKGTAKAGHAYDMEPAEFYFSVPADATEDEIRLLAYGIGLNETTIDYQEIDQKPKWIE